MAQQEYEVQTPDGTTLVVTGPAGASDEQVIAKAKELMAQGQTQQVIEGPKEGGLSDYVTEPLMAIGSGAARTIGGGLAGIKEAALNGAQEGAETVRDIQGAAFQPETRQGQESMQAIGNVAEKGAQIGRNIIAGWSGIADIIAGGDIDTATAKIEEMKQQRALADDVFERTGSPELAATVETLPTALFEALGLKLGRFGAQRGPDTSPQAQARLLELESESSALADAATAAERGAVMTSDVMPPETFIGKGIQQAGERVPAIGTGGQRAAQQESRVSAVKDFASEFDIDPDSQFDLDVVNSANRVYGKQLETAQRLRKEAIDELATHGDVSMPETVRVIDEMIAKELDAGDLGDASLIKELQAIKAEANGDFSRVASIRSRVGDLYSDSKGSNVAGLRKGADSKIDQVYGAMSRDMETFAAGVKQAGQTPEARAALGKWKAQNRVFSDTFKRAKETELKRVLSKGEATPEVIRTVLEGGKPSQLNRLYANLDEAGRSSARQQILQRAFKKSGWPDDVNPQKILTELNKLGNQEAAKVFFKGGSASELAGFKKYLQLTSRAQQANVMTQSGQQVVTPLLIGGAAIDPSIAAIAGSVGGLARIYESAPVRDLFIKLGKAKNAKEAARIRGEIDPYFDPSTDVFNSIITTATAAKENEEQE